MTAQKNSNSDDQHLNNEAASAHARINVPLNLQNWKDQDEDTQSHLLWFHQYLLDQRMGWDEAQDALGYDRSTIFRVLKGTYTGSMPKIVAAIKSYRKLVAQRGTIQQAEFVENSISKLIFAGLDYAMANNSITMIIGPSRSGKSKITREWKERNNHGRSVLVEVPPVGGTKAFMSKLAQAVGVNKNLSVPFMLEPLERAFNKNRILLLDEAHRMLPSARNVNPEKLELVRYLHDATGCAVALVATSRLDQSLKSSEYQFEQVLGRIGMPIRLPKKVKQGDVDAMLKQFIPKPSDEARSIALQLGNSAGRFGHLLETLKVASRIASKQKQALNESHFIKAHQMRSQMMGEK